MTKEVSVLRAVAQRDLVRGDIGCLSEDNGGECVGGKGGERVKGGGRGEKGAGGAKE